MCVVVSYYAYVLYLWSLILQMLLVQFLSIDTALCGCREQQIQTQYETLQYNCDNLDADMRVLMLLLYCVQFSTLVQFNNCCYFPKGDDGQ